MKSTHQVHCDCGAMELSITGQPIVHVFYHCVNSRELLNVPYHTVTAWHSNDVTITKGRDRLANTNTRSWI